MTGQQYTISSLPQKGLGTSWPTTQAEPKDSVASRSATIQPESQIVVSLKPF